MPKKLTAWRCILCDQRITVVEDYAIASNDGWPWAAHHDCIRRLKPELWAQVAGKEVVR